MNINKQRIEIAKACGWKIRHESWPDGIKTLWYHPDHCGSFGRSNPPDYLNDLNAMAVAEKTLTRSPLAGFARHLQEIVGYHCVGVIEYIPDAYIALGSLVQSTAAQRAEAFLKTLGKWQETKETAAHEQ